MPPRDPQLTLRRNHRVEAETSRNSYIVGEDLGEGGFGRAYRAEEVDTRRQVIREVCLKVTSDRDSWVTEAYFGTLVRGESRAVELLDFFPFTVGAGRNHRVLYALVTQLMERGTVDAWCEHEPVQPWPEDRLRREVVAILKLLAKLHATGATHRDITPANVFLGDRGKLVLGDFGLAQHRLDRVRIEDPGFNPAFVPDSLYHLRRQRWLPSDDLYELGVVALTLLTGTALTGNLDRRSLRGRATSCDLGPFLLRLVARRRADRFGDAGEALRELAPEKTPWAPTPTTIRGHKVVITGTLDWPRHEAEQWVRQAGGSVQDAVNGRTSVVVVGRAHPLYRVSPRRGTKLHAAFVRASDGQSIALVDGEQLKRLCRLARR